MSDEVIWITEAPTFTLDGDDLEVTLRSKRHEYTFRLPKGRARKAASDALFLLDEAERRPSNVKPFRKKGRGH